MRSTDDQTHMFSRKATQSSTNAVIGGHLLISLVICIINSDQNNTVAASLIMIPLVYMTIKANKHVLFLTFFTGMITTLHGSTSYNLRTSIRKTLIHVYYRNNNDDYQPISDNIKTWTDIDRSIEDGLPLLGRTARNIITRNQRKCHKGRKVYQVGFYHQGMGSELFFHANVLSMAIEQDALFAWGEKACTKFSTSCRDIYRREHICTSEQLAGMQIENITGHLPLKLPTIFLRLLPASFTRAQAEYWWRTQSTGYIMRLNAETKAKIQEMRLNLHGKHLSLSGAINIHIRHGDKEKEMSITPTELIIDKAAELIIKQPNSFSRTLFVTSDNVDEIYKAKIHAAKFNLPVIYSRIPRMIYGHDAANVDSFWNSSITLSVLMQLSMTAECDAWIGTRSSNWNRIIDMYRCFDAHKCKQIFIEAGDTIPGHYEHMVFGEI